MKGIVLAVAAGIALGAVGTGFSVRGELRALRGLAAKAERCQERSDAVGASAVLTAVGQKRCARLEADLREARAKLASLQLGSAREGQPPSKSNLDAGVPSARSSDDDRFSDKEVKEWLAEGRDSLANLTRELKLSKDQQSAIEKIIKAMNDSVGDAVAQAAMQVDLTSHLKPRDTILLLADPFVSAFKKADSDLRASLREDQRVALDNSKFDLSSQLDVGILQAISEP